MQPQKDFQLTLKIKNRLVDIRLNLNDSKRTIHQKIMQVYPEHSGDMDDLITKVRKQLLALSNRIEAQEEARQVARQIVNKIYKEEKALVHQEWALSEITVNSQVKSCVSDILTLPEKVCFEKYIQTQQTEPREQDLNHYSKNKSFNTYSLNKSGSELTKARRGSVNVEVNKQERPKKSSLNITNCAKQSKSKQQKENRKKCNPDMIKACETIMKKSNHNAMKMMAKEFLKEKGYLAQDVISHEREKRRTYLVSQVSENPEQERTEKRKQSQRRAERQQTTQSNVLVESQSVNVIQAPVRTTKPKSKYNYNISPKNESYAYSLNISYENEAKPQVTQTSMQKCIKKYNYLQN